MSDPSAARREYRTAHWATAGILIGGAVGVACALALLTLIGAGTGERGIFIALRVTARWSFMLFWLAYAGGALAVLFGPNFRAVAQRGREFGLAFAAAHLVHVGLVVWLYRISAKPPVPAESLIFFGIGLFWTYLLALLSIGRVSGLLAPKFLRIVRTIGVEYIALAFLVDFAKIPFGKGLLEIALYAPFLTLAVVGPGLRFAAFARKARARSKIAESFC
jgi:hypothetical protein